MEPVTQTYIEEVWQTLKAVSVSQKESAQQIKELRDSQKELRDDQKELRDSQKETDRQLQETARRMKELSEEAAQRDREATKRINKLDELFNGQWGKLIESLVEGDLVKLLQERNIEVEMLAERTQKRHQDETYEVDIIAVNGTEVVAVEVKTTLGLRDVNDFRKKMKRFKDIFLAYKDKTVYGAVAYLRANAGAAERAAKEGFFVIRATGGSASITNKESFKPRAF